jgi:hypothetical protein
VLVVGKASAGADCGSQRLLSLVSASADKVSCRPMREARKPFFNVRDMHLAAEGELAGKSGNFEWWDDHDRLLGIGKQ